MFKIFFCLIALFSGSAFAEYKISLSNGINVPKKEVIGMVDASSPSDGYGIEMLIFNKELSMEELNVVHDYLKSKCALN